VLLPRKIPGIQEFFMMFALGMLYLTLRAANPNILIIFSALILQT
jgi:hypothetical protein